MPKLISVEKARDGLHKYVASFITDEGREKNVKFGMKGYLDYTISTEPDEKRRQRRARYLDRHRGTGENWSNPITAGALSRWLLWGETTSFQDNLKEFRKKFQV
jgi:hypothetical protein